METITQGSDDYRSDEKPLLVSLDQAGIYSGGRWIIHNISLKIYSGEIVTLIGPNGSGKSTTAKTILGLKRLTHGHTWYKPGLRVGYVPQKLDIDWTIPLRVKRFINLTSVLDDREIRSALKMVDAEHTFNKDVKHLSGGEFQRVLLARAIVLKPDLLVLDEPVQGVDINGCVALYNLIEETQKYLNCAVLLISHDLHIVMRSTDRVICLNGHICCHGAPVDVLNSVEYLNLFGQQGMYNLAMYHHHHDHVHSPDGRVCPEGGAGDGDDKGASHA